ncbi:endonuclease/exonuclease/phosphatase family protein [Sphingobacterium sp. LRF_L2]|uniref:endonuclease/exonuclease/phosphatase family protein n=1 Tax=Sphingobacterium sp. LRF_L2 TaxID=3369421 RepID=UPI003F6193A4
MKNISLAILLLLTITCCSSTEENELLQEKSKIVMLTYNVHHGAPANSEVVNLEHIAAVIKQSNAELVALQEIDVNVPRSGNINQAEQLAELLGMEYHFSKSIDYQGGEYGVAILSKYPLINKRRVELPMPIPGEKRSVALATVRLPDGKTIEFGSTHLDLNVPNRTAQAEFLNGLSLTEAAPLFIGGDYNAERNTTEMILLQQEYSLSCVNGCPNSYPVRNPTKSIDLIVANKLAVKKYNVLSAVAMTGQYASDHLPVVVIYQSTD